MDAGSFFLFVVITLLQMTVPAVVGSVVFAGSAIGGLWLVEELSAKPEEWKPYAEGEWGGQVIEGTWTGTYGGRVYGPYKHDVTLEELANHPRTPE